MKIAAGAYPIDWHNRWNDYVGKLRVWVRTAAEGGAELLVFPEFAAIELASLAGEKNARAPHAVVEALAARLKDVDALHASLAREFGVHICAATGPIRASGGRVLNRARLFAPDGRRGEADQGRVAPEAAETWGLESGGAPLVFETALGRIGVLIGTDLAAPDLAAAMARAGAALVIAPGRAGTAEAAGALREAALARAAETGCVVVQAMALGLADWCPAVGRSTGSAAVLGPPVEGEADGVIAAGKADAPGWVQAEVDPAAYGARRAAGPIDASEGEPVAEVIALAGPPAEDPILERRAEPRDP